MRSNSTILLTLVACLTGNAALACSPAPANEGWKFKSVYPDSSFDKAGRGKWNSFRGQPVVDLGNGRIGQRLSSGDACRSQQNLFFMDCSSAEGIVIGGQLVGSETIVGADGKKVVSLPIGVHESIELIQRPLGPIDLSEQTTVPELQSIVKNHRYRSTTSLDTFFGRTVDQKKVDYTCGCKLYYPDSPGAKL